MAAAAASMAAYAASGRRVVAARRPNHAAPSASPAKKAHRVADAANAVFPNSRRNQRIHTVA